MSRFTDQIANAEHVSEYSFLVNGNLFVEHAELMYKNFSGGPTPANPVGGKRTFCLMLNEETAEALVADGWNVKVKEIHNEYNPDEKTRPVKFEDWKAFYKDQFENSVIYTEICIKDDGDYPPTISKASEYNGEKTIISIPMDRWGDLDNSVLEDVTVTIHPWKHRRNLENPEAKKGYLNSLITKVRPVVPSGLGNTYSGYRVVDA